MGMPGPWELIIILLIVVMIFGAKRIPEIMGGVGKGIRVFKKTMEGDEAAPAQSTETQAVEPPKQDSAKSEPIQPK